MEHLAGSTTDGVDHDVDAAEAIDGLAHHPLGVGLVGRVALDREAFRASRNDAIDCGLQGVGGPARDRDPGARRRNGLRQRRTDPAAAAWDQGDPTLEAEHVELGHAASFRSSSVLAPPSSRQNASPGSAA